MKKKIHQKFARIFESNAISIIFLNFALQLLKPAKIYSVI